MKKLLLMFSLLVSISTANAFDKIYEGTLEDFENLQVTENGITLNNFSLAEKDSFMAKGITKVQVSFSVRNKNQDSRAVTVMIVGKSSEKILWAVNAGPMMALVSGNKTDQCNGSAYVTPGTVKQTTKFWLRIVGDF